MKKNILFLATGYEGWKGGLYYVKNMLYGLLQYEKTYDSFNIYILVEKQDKDIFIQYEKKYDNVSIIINNVDFFSKIRKKTRKIICKQILGKSIVWDLSDGIMEKYKIDIVFPLLQSDYKYNKKAIAWIPDFQYLHYPDFFSQEELEYREATYLEIAKTHNRLVLSSQDAYRDYQNNFREYVENVYVVPFVSAINPVNVTKQDMQILQDKYELPEKYFIVSNQFWQHKNHETVFKAIYIAKEKYGISITLACTGLLQNDRNPKYAENLIHYLEKNNLQNEIKILGHINREEQLKLMSGSIAVVQPSLFEGWGTVVEDAKTLNKTIIMSDIAVHFEQKTDKCIIFEKTNADELASILVHLWNQKTDASMGSYDMQNVAAEYGEKFYNLLMGM